MDIRRGNIQYLSEGSSALVATPIRFRVLEGGQSHRNASHTLNRCDDYSCTHSHHSFCNKKNAIAFFFVICSMTLILIFTAFFMDVSTATHKAASFSDVSTEIVTVMPGDSLWSIASQHPVDGCSTEEVVEFISEQNELSSSMLSSGQQLYVPAS